MSDKYISLIKLGQFFETNPIFTVVLSKKRYFIIYFWGEDWSKNAHMGFKSIRGYINTISLDSTRSS